MKSRLLLLLIAALYLYVMFNRQEIWQQKGYAFAWDKGGYYVYLPALFIYHDLGRLTFYKEINRKYELTFERGIYYACYDQPATGMRVNKYGPGIAIAQLPFFWLGHAITCIDGTYPADGFSYYYQFAIYLSTAFWAIMGLIAVRNLLSRYFAEEVVMPVLLLLAFGTNLYSYAVFDSGMSHPYSFAFFAIALNCADRYYAEQKLRHLLVAATFMGWIIIARPTNGLFVIVPALWGIWDTNDLMQRLRLFRQRWYHLAPALVLFAAMLLIQMGYWKYVTGHWIHDSYEEEGFNFLHPHIWEGLFSYRKGWFVYTPVALICLLGLIIVKKQYPRFFWAIALYCLLNIYVVFSWYAWYYGGSFGCRALVESFAVLAFPLASLMRWIYSKRNIIKITATGILVLFCALNIWQTYQYSLNIIPYDENTSAYYWRVFFKQKANTEDYHLLEKKN